MMHRIAAAAAISRRQGWALLRMALAFAALFSGYLLAFGWPGAVIAAGLASFVLAVRDYGLVSSEEREP